MATKFTSTAIVAFAKSEIKKNPTKPTIIDIYSVKKAYAELADATIINTAIEELKKVRGVTKVVVTDNDSVDTGRKDIWNCRVYKEVPSQITIYPKPCKEIAAIESFLTKHNAINKTDKYSKVRTITDTHTDWVSGKRSTIFDRSPEYLAYNEKKCAKILDWLKLNTKPNYKIEYKITHELDDADRFNGRGEDRECEWDGWDEMYIEFTISTPTGRVRANTSFLAK